MDQSLNEAIEITKDLEQVIRWLQDACEIQEQISTEILPLVSIKDVIFKEVRRYFIRAGVNVEPLKKLNQFCVKCGTYEGVHAIGGYCQRCTSIEEYSAKSGDKKMHIYIQNNHAKIMKYFGVVAGSSIPDFAIRFSAIAYKQKITHFIFDNSLVGGYYTNDDDTLEIHLYKDKIKAEKKAKA